MRAGLIVVPLTVLVVIAAIPRQSLAADVPRLEVQSALFYRTGGHRTLVKRLDPGQAFQGRAITRDRNVLMAYDGPGSEASTVLSIYDVKANRESVIVEIGGTGDTSSPMTRKPAW